MFQRKLKTYFTSQRKLQTYISDHVHIFFMRFSKSFIVNFKINARFQKIIKRAQLSAIKLYYTCG